MKKFTGRSFDFAQDDDDIAKKISNLGALHAAPEEDSHRMIDLPGAKVPG